MTRQARSVRRLAASGVISLAALAGLGACATVAGVTDPPTASVGGAVTGPRAHAIAAQVVDTAQKAAATTGPEGNALRESAYTGAALTAAAADAKLAGGLTQQQKQATALTPAAPLVLAVSAGPSYPRSMVVQTTRATSGLPVLYLLTTPDARTPFKIAASAPMLPSAQVPAFDQVAQGAPALGDDAAGLSLDPDKLLAAYAASLAFPAPQAAGQQPFAPDAFATKVRAAAKAQNDALVNGGTFREDHVAKGVAGGLRLAGNQGALVFTVLERKDSIGANGATQITTSSQFKALTGLSAVKTQASLDTLELVVFVVPENGPAQAVAAEEHLLAASGT